jgi:uncharacterized protein involved in response to NO
MARCHRSLSHPYDPDLSRMLKVFIATGIAFMLLPGTFVGVMNLLKISATHTSGAADAGWIQAHGHAQIFGWLGTFILGIGFYTIPRLRLSPFHQCTAWITYALWVTGVTMRWAVGTWPSSNWRLLFPLASTLELLAGLIFCYSVYLSRPRSNDEGWRTSVLMITAAGWAMLAALVFNAWQGFVVAEHGAGPVLPFDVNQRYLVLITWGFVVPFVWGFSTRWLPALLGLRKSRKEWMLPVLALSLAGVGVALAGYLLASSIILFVASLGFIHALRIWEPLEKKPTFRGVHPSAGFFARSAYAWLLVAGVLAIVAAARPLPNGYAGAGRHALTVGFFSIVVFVVGPRVLPAFFNVVRLWSPRLMAASLTLLSIGCTVRVVSQVLAYEQISQLAWKTLPLSAVIEMTAVTLFAFNMVMTLTVDSPLELLAKEGETPAGNEPRPGLRAVS